ncbi:MAG TPA: hypothetical protein VI279_11825 [Rhodocyclaceae bacterium]
MKRFLIAAAVSATALSAPALAADVGVSVSVGQPGFYGRIDIGDFPPPTVIYREPMVVERVVVDRPPIYLRVPPGHARHWSKHCREYNACGERVYFVRDEWYHQEYVPRYRERHGDWREERHEERREGRDHEKHGHGHGHGHDD